MGQQKASQQLRGPAIQQAIQQLHWPAIQKASQKLRGPAIQKASQQLQSRQTVKIAAAVKTVTKLFTLTQQHILFQIKLTSFS